MEKTVIGIDIGGTNTRVGLVTQEGEIRAETAFKTQEFDTARDYSGALTETIRALLTDRPKPLGIGIGAPNGNFYSGAIEYAPNLKWKGVIPLADELARNLDMPARLTNDANAAALGEKLFGSAQDLNHFIVITLGTGLGSGIVVNGELVYGHDGFAGEIGHTIMDFNGRQCGCGRRGCLETYASATGICRTVAELLAERTEDSPLRSVAQDKLNAQRIYEEARHGDPIALEAFERTGKTLARGLANSVAHTSPEAIILLGGLAEAGDLILEPTSRHLDACIHSLYRGKVRLMISSLKAHNTALLGAAALIWHDAQADIP